MEQIQECVAYKFNPRHKFVSHYNETKAKTNFTQAAAFIIVEEKNKTLFSQTLGNMMYLRLQSNYFFNMSTISLNAPI